MLATKMTEMLGVRYPIQCGTMHGLTTAEVVAPVAEVEPEADLAYSLVEARLLEPTGKG